MSTTEEFDPAAARAELSEKRGRVLWLVLREVAGMAIVGIVGGLAAALWLTRQVQSQLYGLTPTDPLTLGAAMLLLAFVAIGSGYLPARRATAIDPIVALRAE